MKLCVTPLLLGGILLLMGSSNAAASRGARFYPNVPLINQDGKTLNFYDDVIKGKVVSINFMFTSCEDSCPLETAKLLEVQRRLGEHAGKNVHMYSITVDPDRDTPEVLKDYMRKYKIGPGWEFLTGKIEDIDQIRKKLGMYVEGDNQLEDHTISFVIGNEKTGRWVKRSPFDVPGAIVTVMLGRIQTRSLLSTIKRADYATLKKKKASRPGEDLFITRCTVCHTIGKGQSSGPNLMGVAEIRDLKWLIRWLMEPDVMLKEKDPLATALFEAYDKMRMPNLKLSEQDAIDLIYFIQVESKQAMEEMTASIAKKRDQSANQHRDPGESIPKHDDRGNQKVSLGPSRQP